MEVKCNVTNRYASSRHTTEKGGVCMVLNDQYTVFSADYSRICCCFIDGVIRWWHMWATGSGLIRVSLYVYAKRFILSQAATASLCAATVSLIRRLSTRGLLAGPHSLTLVVSELFCEHDGRSFRRVDVGCFHELACFFGDRFWVDW